MNIAVSTSTAYASARIDGILECHTLRVGILQAPVQLTPVVSFYVQAGLQRHPVWALDRLAAVVYCYCQMAKEKLDDTIEINLSANLISGSEAICMVASKITWHTSRDVRLRAERMIAEMTCNGVRWSSDCWPFTNPMQMPVRKK